MKILICFVVEKIIALQFVVKVVKSRECACPAEESAPKQGFIYISPYPEYSIPSAQAQGSVLPMKHLSKQPAALA